MDQKTLHKISYGLYIICSKKGKEISGQIVNALFQVTAQPPSIAVSINKQNLTHEFICNSQVFTVSILSEKAPMPFIGTFGFKSGRDINKFKNISFKLGKNEAPIILNHTIGYIEAQVINQIDVGTHTIFISNVTEADLLSNDTVMTYDYYHKVKGGISPKTAPTYSGMVDINMEVKNMATYRCTVCGYVYDPKNGDSDSGIAPGTRFEDLPDDWVCPVCGAGKDAFEKE